MARKLVLPAVLLFSLLICSCSRNGFKGPVDHNSLIWEWQWVMQTDATPIYGTPYDTLTPASIGILSRQMTLTQDSLYMMVTLSASQQHSEIGKFKIIEALTPGGPVK